MASHVQDQPDCPSLQQVNSLVDLSISDNAQPSKNQDSEAIYHALPEPEYKLQVLHESHDSIIDIVAVHGLGEKPTDAWLWQPKNNPPDEAGYPTQPFNWLTELLPRSLACRVMAFNYDSNGFFNALPEDVSDISDGLLDEMLDSRRNPEDWGRPIIFIGHGFGGNIIQQAIVSASRLRSEYREIDQAVVGLVFLGTPHRGSRAASWAKIIASFAPPTLATEPSLLPALEEMSDSVADCLRLFYAWLFSESVRVVCAFEALLTDSSSHNMMLEFIPHKNIVVPESSACIAGHHTIALLADHFKINKFYGPDDPSFKLIYPEIERMVQDAEENYHWPRAAKRIPEDGGLIHGDLCNCLDLMEETPAKFMLYRVENHKGKRFRNTCTWILGREEFSAWAASQDSRLLRLIGPPGIGKTIMSAFLVERLKKKVERSHKNANALFAYFFYDDQQGVTTRPTSMLRSLVWQLIVQRHELFRHIQCDFVKHRSSRVFHDLLNNFSAMWRILGNMLRDECAGEVFILVDAVDECERSTRELLLRSINSLFQSAAPTAPSRIKFLITSRPGIDGIEDVLPPVGLSLRMDSDDLKKDMSDFIEIQVRKFSTNRKYRSMKDKVRDKFCGQADIPWLWFSVAANVLSKARMKQAEKTLDTLPIGLDNTYAWILDRIDSESQQSDARFLLLTLATARRPLKKIEIAAAFAVWKKGLVLQKDELKDYMNVCSLCHPLLHLQTADNDDDDEDDSNTTVTFCHQSVKDFLLHRPSQSGSNNNNNNNNPPWYHTTLGRAELLLFQVCWQILTTEGNKGRWAVYSKNKRLYKTTLWPSNPPCQKFPLLMYANHHWDSHAIRTSPSIVERELGLPESKVDLSKAPALHGYWLLRAAKSGQEGMVKALLEHKKNGAHVQVDVMDSIGQTPLSNAASQGHEAVVKLLLEKGAKVSSTNQWGQTPFAMAVKNGHQAVAELLLEQGDAEVDSRDEDDETPLSNAAESGQVGTVQLLIDKGAEADSKSKGGQTPLFHAAEKGHTAVVKLLLEKGGADVNSESCNGPARPLSLAAQNGHTAVVEALLEKGAEIDFRADIGQTPLSKAAEKGYTRTVQLLLERGADVELADNKGRTPLSWAAQMGETATLELLLDQGGANIESKDECDRTPLSWASRKNQPAAVKVLLDRGADIETRDDKGRTPMALATKKKWYPYVMEVLYERGARPVTSSEEEEQEEDVVDYNSFRGSERSVDSEFDSD